MIHAGNTYFGFRNKKVMFRKGEIVHYIIKSLSIITLSNFYASARLGVKILRLHIGYRNQFAMVHEDREVEWCLRNGDRHVIKSL